MRRRGRRVVLGFLSVTSAPKITRRALSCRIRQLLHHLGVETIALPTWRSGTLLGIGLGIGILTLDTFSHGTLSEVATLFFIMFIVVAGGFLLSGVFFMARAAGAKLGL